MKKEFADAILKEGLSDPNLIFMTGDLGYNAFEELVKQLTNRFINAGVAEQSMVSIAAGIAKSGFQPWVYSIAPFLVLKTVEQIRNDVCHMKLPVKLVGNGGGYGYGIMGSTHHLLEDLAILSALPEIELYIPAFSEDVATIVKKMHASKKPGYLRLGLGKPSPVKLSAYSPFRRIVPGKKVTIVTVGPLVHQALEALQSVKQTDRVDLWNITRLPFTIPEGFFESVKKTKSLLIYEEHTRRSGVGEKVLAELARSSISVRVVRHFSAEGYPSKLYGDQNYHLKEHQLDAQNITRHLSDLL